jgi:protein pelota
MYFNTAMQIISKDLRKGYAKVKVENKDDIWYLSTIIEEHDIVRGQTTRKVKLDGGSDERKANVSIRKVTLSICVEKVEFHKYTGDLRVSGKIIGGQEDIPAGSYHTLNIEDGSTISIEKEAWLNYQVKRLEEACANQPIHILICVFDRDEALFALMKKYGYEVLAEIKGDVQKKAVDEKVKASFYSEIINMLKQFDQRYKLSSIIMASPGFWKDEFSKELEDKELKKKIVFATSSSANKSAINEVLKRPEVISALKQDRVVKEVNLVNEVLTEIKKDGLVSYGIKETREAATMGAVKTLVVTDNYIQASREKNSYAEIERTMRCVDSAQGEVFIISSEHEGGKSLDGLGGIGALLRYRIR